MEIKVRKTRKSLSKQVMESIEKLILDQKLRPGGMHFQQNSKFLRN